MRDIKFVGKLKLFFKAPILIVALLIIADILMFFQNVRFGAALTIITLSYLIFVIVLYRLLRGKVTKEIFGFAERYAKMQTNVVDNLSLGYALIDANGKLIWMNEKFADITGVDRVYSKSITSIFSEITREAIAKLDENSRHIRVTFDGKVFEAEFRSLDMEGIDDVSAMITIDGLIGKLYSVVFYDITENTLLKSNIASQRMVYAIVHIDNYEEVYDSVEEARKSLVAAIVERKISKYFSAYDSIFRRMDRDKYFAIFKYESLEKLEKDKFSIIEDIRTVRAGNEMEVTLSIGVGAGGDSYNQNAEFARVANDLALARGGSQAVVKTKDDVRYYGTHGKEIEKSTRVKARIKAQALREIMETHGEIIIMGHSITDVDSFGSAIGIFCAAREVGKHARIVLNTVTNSLKPLVDLFINEDGYDEDVFITSEQALAIVDASTLVVVVDTNRPSYTDCPELLNVSKSIVVFDHHRQGSEQIQGPVLSYIEPYASSACEMITEVLQYFADKVNLSKNEADCIYAGILIDTSNFMTKTGVRTFEAAAYLRRSGAEVTRVRKLLREDMSAYKARAEIVRNAQVYRDKFAISTLVNNEIESPTVVGAKAANELLNIIGIKASFVLSEYEGKIFISARSIDEIDVQAIMSKLGGGGHLNVAGAQLQNTTMDEAKRMIQQTIDSFIEEGDIEA